MTASVEEEELPIVSFLVMMKSERTYLGDDEGLDKHDHAAGND